MVNWRMLGKQIVLAAMPVGIMTLLVFVYLALLGDPRFAPSLGIITNTVLLALGLLLVTGFTSVVSVVFAFLPRKFPQNVTRRAIFLAGALAGTQLGAVVAVYCNTLPVKECLDLINVTTLLGLTIIVLVLVVYYIVLHSPGDALLSLILPARVNLVRFSCHRSPTWIRIMGCILAPVVVLCSILANQLTAGHVSLEELGAGIILGVAGIIFILILLDPMRLKESPAPGLTALSSQNNSVISQVRGNYMIQRNFLTLILARWARSHQHRKIKRARKRRFSRTKSRTVPPLSDEERSKRKRVPFPNCLTDVPQTVEYPPHEKPLPARMPFHRAHVSAGTVLAALCILGLFGGQMIIALPGIGDAFVGAPRIVKNSRPPARHCRRVFL